MLVKFKGLGGPWVEGAEQTFLLIPSLSVPAKTQGLVEGVVIWYSAYLVCKPS